MFTSSCSAFASTDLHTLFQSYVALSAPVIAGLDVQMPPWLGDVSGIVLAAFATCLSCLFALASPLTYLCDLLFKLGSMIGSKMGWKCWGIGALVAEAKTAVAANAQDEAQRELEDHYAPADEQEESDDAAIGEMEKGLSKEELVSAVKSDQGTSQAVYTPLETVTCMNERDQDGGVRTPMDEPTVCFRTRALLTAALAPRNEPESLLGCSKLSGLLQAHKRCVARRYHCRAPATVPTDASIQTWRCPYAAPCSSLRRRAAFLCRQQSSPSILSFSGCACYMAHKEGE